MVKIASVVLWRDPVKTVLKQLRRQGGPAGASGEKRDAHTSTPLADYRGDLAHPRQDHPTLAAWCPASRLGTLPGAGLFIFC